jgi:hypothetical protein
MRRAWWLAVAAVLALLVGACSGGNGSKKTTTTSAGTTPTAAATSGGGATATAGLASPTVAGTESTPVALSTNSGARPCAPAGVTARANAQSGEGSIGGAVIISNTTSTFCALNAPTVSLQGADGKELVSGSAPGGASPTLAGGQSASITFIWTNWCGDAPAGPLSVAVRAGGDPIVTTIAGTSAGAVPVPRCDAQAEPSKLSVTDIRLQPTR